VIDQTEGHGAIELRAAAEQRNHSGDLDKDQPPRRDRKMPGVSDNVIDAVMQIIVPKEFMISCALNSAMSAKIEPLVALYAYRHLLACPKLHFGRRLFSVDETGVVSIVVPCIDSHNVVVDFAAFDITDQRRMGRWAGVAWCVGEENIFMSNSFGDALAVHADIWSFLASGGSGVLLLDVGRALRELHDRGIKRLVVSTTSTRIWLERQLRQSAHRLLPEVCVQKDDLK